VLGAVIGAAALEGRDKLTVLADAPLSAFAGWIEQIVAGKDGQSIIVVGHGGIFTVTLPDLCPKVDLHYLRTENHNCSISEIEVEWNGGRLEGRLISWASYAHLHGPAADLVSGLPDMER